MGCDRWVEGWDRWLLGLTWWWLLGLAWVVVAMFCEVVVHAGYRSDQSQLVGSTIKIVLTENYTQVFEPNASGIELREEQDYRYVI